MSREELAEDLAYVRALAEEGRHAPLIGGSFLVFWGVLNAIAYLAHWALLTGNLPNGNGLAFPVLWGAYGVIAGLVMSVMGARLRTRPGFSSIANRVHGAAWNGASIAISVIAVASIVRMALDQDERAVNAIMGAAFALIGAVMVATALISRQGWLRWFAALAFAGAAVTTIYQHETWAYLAASAFSVAVLLAPGWALTRLEPRAIV